MLAEPEISIFVLEDELAVLTLKLAVEVSDPDRFARPHSEEEIIAIAHEVGDLVAGCTYLDDAGLVHVQAVKRYSPGIS
ncbi:hypothetical protein SAMN05421750_11322 [Agrobacterium pusense]|nr:hypothetical protein [Rhizobium sp. SORGH_AS_0755]SDF44698.1 hypothetical protein SAMN05421750_11322 [Agrobacterium pusense]